MSPRESSGRQFVGELEGSRLNAMLGKKLQLRRLLLGLSQAEVAASLSVSSQQVAQFEKGEARMFASHLYILSRTLDVSVNFFFEETQASAKSNDYEVVAESKKTYPIAEFINETKTDEKTRRQVRLLVEAFHRIPPGKMRTNLLRTVKHLAR